jgi:hypothetical protein
MDIEVKTRLNWNFVELDWRQVLLDTFEDVVRDVVMAVILQPCSVGLRPTHHCVDAFPVAFCNSDIVYCHEEVLWNLFHHKSRIAMEYLVVMVAVVQLVAGEVLVQ